MIYIHKLIYYLYLKITLKNSIQIKKLKLNYIYINLKFLIKKNV